MRSLAKRFLFAVTFFSLVLISLSSGLVSAISGATVLTTSPIFIDLVGTPGQPASTNLSVQNNGTSPTTISIKLEKFKAYGIHGQAAIYSPGPNDPSMNWVHFSKNNFIAQPNVWNTLKMTINLPPTAALGYYYAVLFSASNNLTVKDKAATFKSANAIFVLVNASSSNEVKKLEVTSFSASKKIYNFLPATFTITIKNPGNIFIAPEGDVYISRRPGGKTIDSLAFNPDLNNVLPNSSRQFSVSWTNGFPVYKDKTLHNQIISNKQGQPIRYLDWNYDKPLSDFRFGKYYANLALVYNDGITEVPVNAVVSFWVIPWTLILELILTILLILAIIGLIIRGFKRGWTNLFDFAKPKKGTSRHGRPKNF